MKNKIAVIEHVEMVGNALSATTMDFKNQPQEVTETKCLQEILEEQKSIPFTIQHVPYIETPRKSGKESRRERRAKERKK